MPKKHANIIILVVSDLFAPGALVNIVIWQCQNGENDNYKIANWSTNPLECH